MRFRSNSILAYVPRNADGGYILKQSLEVHHALGMRVFVMDVVRIKGVFSQLFQSKQLLKNQREEVEKLDEFIEDTIKKEVPKEVITRIRWGNVVKTLINESIKGGYEFVMIDKSGDKFKGALKKREIDKFISKSHCPVLAINKNFPVKEVNKIVVPIDISQTTKKRLYWATFFAKQQNAKIHIVSALNIDIEETKSLAFKNAEKLKHMLLERGVDCDVKILKVHNQSKYKAVLDYIREEKADMVIIRTHQEYRFSGRKIGKFVSEIIHNCKIPVFTVGGPTKNIMANMK